MKKKISLNVKHKSDLMWCSMTFEVILHFLKNLGIHNVKKKDSEGKKIYNKKYFLQNIKKSYLEFGLNFDEADTCEC